MQVHCLGNRVLPSAKERYCFSVWMSNAPRRTGLAQGDPPGTRSVLPRSPEELCALSDAAKWELLLHPSVRKHAAKAAYADEWAASIQVLACRPPM
jgi:hypothetical protein